MKAKHIILLRLKHNLLIASLTVVAIATLFLPLLRRGTASPTTAPMLTVSSHFQIDARRCLSDEAAAKSRILDFRVTNDRGVFLIGNRSSRWLTATSLQGTCLAGSEIQSKSNRIVSASKDQVVLESFRKGPNNTLLPVLLRFAVNGSTITPDGTFEGAVPLVHLQPIEDGWMGVEPRLKELRRVRESAGKLVEDTSYQPSVVLDILPQYLFAPTPESGFYVLEEGTLSATLIDKGGQIVSKFPLIAPEIDEALSKIPPERRPIRPDPKAANIFESAIVFAATSEAGNLLVVPSRFDPRQGMKVLEFEMASGRHTHSFLLAPPAQLGELRPGAARLTVAGRDLWIIDQTGRACTYSIPNRVYSQP